MHLLNVHTFKLEHFSDSKRRPDYAILSHTWGDDEVSFLDLPAPAARSMAGYAKVKKCCEQGIQDGFEYVWIDTCCIDKASSSELSEAVNSMYQWYENARVCYVFLSDVKTSIQGDSTDLEESGFSKSRWFTRGWTLQELLAPKSIVFFSRDWVEIGTKQTLREELSKVTGIPSEVLLFLQPLDEINISQRMSWAATRETTREEDAAYCLMGIFSVNMPTLYGEGQNSFVRLQYEIMRQSEDHSLFAWTTPSLRQQQKGDDRHWMDPDGNTLLENSDNDTSESGLLAISPKAFQYGQEVRQLKSTSGAKMPYSMTNKGLHIRLPIHMVQATNLGYGKVYLAVLNCEIIDARGPLGIYLKKSEAGQYTRIFTTVLRTSVIDVDLEPTELYVKEIYSSASEGSHLNHEYKIHLFPSPSIKHSYTVLDVYESASSQWLLPTRTFKVNPPQFNHNIGIAAVRIGFGEEHAVEAILILGVNNPKEHPGLWCTIHPSYESAGARDLGGFCAANPKPMGQLSLDRIAEQFPNGHIISAAIHSAPRDVESLSQSYRIILKNLTSNSFLGLGQQHPQAGHLGPSPVPPLPRLTVHLDSEMDPRIQQGGSWGKCWSVLTHSDNSSMILLWSPTPKHTSATLFLRVGSSCAYAVVLRATNDTFSVEGLNGAEQRQSPVSQNMRLGEGRTLHMTLRPKMLVGEVGHQMWMVIEGTKSKSASSQSTNPRIEIVSVAMSRKLLEGLRVRPRPLNYFSKVSDAGESEPPISLPTKLRETGKYSKNDRVKSSRW
ncbi:hypothetical protein GALMADRAFT_249933 [Galerina marginata CBS 339.88]|uniref:Uncharacterized protein n=1 Tax=Galerina marginata (strain CBS 339.88) TaxID=685588 RepID=A0A067T7M8_GALM3|nr:hypothetical protein GALMADRAFT_249933 [Galerina marginata CBS 339.88]